MIRGITAVLVVVTAVILGLWWNHRQSITPTLYWATVVGVEGGQSIESLLPPLQSSSLVGIRMFKANDPFADKFEVSLPSVVGWLAGSLVQQLLPLLQCGQRYTAKDIEQQETLLLLKPNIAKDTVITENIRKIVTESGLDIRISNVKVLSDTRAASFYRDHIGKPYFDDLLSYISSGPTYVMILTGLDAIKVIRKIVGPTDPVIARHEAPDSLRALYGVDLTMNSVHASDSLASAAHEIQIICSI